MVIVTKKLREEISFDLVRAQQPYFASLSLASLRPFVCLNRSATLGRWK